MHSCLGNMVCSYFDELMLTSLIECSEQKLLDVCTYRTRGDAREQLVQDAVTKLVVQLSQQHGELARLQLGSESSRIGTLGVARTGALGFTEVNLSSASLAQLM